MLLFAAGKKDKTDTGFQEKNGIRCVRLNPDGTRVASGDRAGNVRCGILLWNGYYCTVVFLNTLFMKNKKINKIKMGLILCNY